MICSSGSKDIHQSSFTLFLPPNNPGGERFSTYQFKHSYLNCVQLGWWYLQDGVEIWIFFGGGAVMQLLNASWLNFTDLASCLGVK